MKSQQIFRGESGILTQVPREGEVYLALTPLYEDYHYHQEGEERFILNKAVNKLSSLGRSMGQKA